MYIFSANVILDSVSGIVLGYGCSQKIPEKPTQLLQDDRELAVICPRNGLVYNFEFFLVLSQPIVKTFDSNMVKGIIVRTLGSDFRDLMKMIMEYSEPELPSITICLYVNTHASDLSICKQINYNVTEFKISCPNSINVKAGDQLTVVVFMTGEEPINVTITGCLTRS